jgi:hypothetical protein
MSDGGRETEPGPEEGKSVSFLQELHKRPWSWILPIIILPDHSPRCFRVVFSVMFRHRFRPALPSVRAPIERVHLASRWVPMSSSRPSIILTPYHVQLWCSEASVYTSSVPPGTTRQSVCKRGEESVQPHSMASCRGTGTGTSPVLIACF